MLEVNITLPAHRNHFDSMAEITLGFAGRAIAWISSVCLFYSLIAAYISGNAALFIRALSLIGINLPAYTSAILFTIIIGAIVFFSTRGVDLFKSWFNVIQRFSPNYSFCWVNAACEYSALTFI